MTMIRLAVLSVLLVGVANFAGAENILLGRWVWFSDVYLDETGDKTEYDRIVWTFDKETSDRIVEHYLRAEGYSDKSKNGIKLHNPALLQSTFQRKGKYVLEMLNGTTGKFKVTGDTGKTTAYSFSVTKGGDQLNVTIDGDPNSTIALAKS